MNRNFLKFLTIILPVVFFVALIVVRSSLISSPVLWGVETIIIMVALLGIVLFSSWVFGVIERNEIDIKQQAEQLAALHEAAISLTRELDLTMVLQKVVDLARELSSAKYGALGVLEEDGRWIDQFIFSGIPNHSKVNMGATPRGFGLLGAVIQEGKPIRVSRIGEDKRSMGFPSFHPAMQSFLGVPIRFKGEVIGELYLSDKSGILGETLEFTEQDQRILEMFATQAAIAIKNAQLYRQAQQLTVLQERERFGMDLHDGIIQSIYAIGLMLDDTQHRMLESPESAREGIAHAITGLNEVIRDIRNYILDLRPNRFQGRDLKEGLGELVRELRANSFLEVALELDGTSVAFLDPEKTVEILHIAQESLSNIRKHARATRVEICLCTYDSELQMMIKDDGVGIDLEKTQNSTGNGLRNMQERAFRLGAIFDVENLMGGGTEICVKIPLTEERK
ncbi:MAG: GAF domain-containing sensor histidine kinase [Anaerolineales bacterium]|nr:GAF domain-containing sensor histidine kinase [Anaerolineales bacterium]